jgi:hypothetical protein
MVFSEPRRATVNAKHVIESQSNSDTSQFALSVIGEEKPAVRDTTQQYERVSEMEPPQMLNGAKVLKVMIKLVT